VYVFASYHLCDVVQIKDDLVDAASAKAAAEAAQRGNMLMNALWSIVGGGKQVRQPSCAASHLAIQCSHACSTSCCAMLAVGAA
jgi:hypothetical protein